MALVSRTDLRLSHLRFPFAVRVDALRGTARLRDANARREVWPGNPFVVPAFSYFDCDLLPAPGRSTMIGLSAVPDNDCPRMTQAAAPGGAYSMQKYWSRALATEMFDLPTLAWNAALVAERWQTTPRLVRARLFAEGEALRTLLREQRVAHTIYLLARDNHAPPEWLASQVGLAGVAALRAACANTLGPSALNLLAERNGLASSPGLAPAFTLAA
jgi:hypothetical protein